MPITYQPFNETLLPETFEPRTIDILCGRGRTWCHHGNKEFTQTVQNRLEDYMKAEQSISKGLIVSEVVDKFRDRGSLFLKQDTETKRWYDIGDHQARYKTGHAFRDQCATLKKKRNNTREPEKQNLKSLRIEQDTTASTRKKSFSSSSNQSCNLDTLTDTVSRNDNAHDKVCNGDRVVNHKNSSDDCMMDVRTNCASLEKCAKDEQLGEGKFQKFDSPFTSYDSTNCETDSLKADKNSFNSSTKQNDSSMDDLMKSSDEILHWYRTNETHPS